MPAMCYFHVNLLKTTYIKKLQLFVTINSLQRSNFASDASTWPSGLRRQFQALVFSNAWVRKFKKKDSHWKNTNLTSI